MGTDRPDRLGRERLGRESAYLLLSWPVLLVGFCVIFTLAAVGVLLVVVWVGIPILLLALGLARGLAQAERGAQHRWLDRPVVEGAYRPRVPGRSWHRAALDAVTDPQAWLDLLFACLAWIVSTVTWSIAITWWSAVIAGLSAPLWGYPLYSVWGGEGTASLIFGGASATTEVVFNLGLGLLALLTLRPVIHTLTSAQTELFAAILGSSGLRARVDDLQASRSAAQDAEAGALRKLERDLHDGPQQRIVRLQMDLGRALSKLEDDPATARAAVESSMTQARETLDELRSLSRGIASPILLDRGLAAALDDLAARSVVPARLRTNLVGIDAGIPVRVQNATYYLVPEALTNAAKHSGATAVEIGATLSEGMLRLTVSDDGRGGAGFGTGSGLPGLRDRVRGLDGRFEVSSPPGGPTTLTALLPCEPETRG